MSEYVRTHIVDAQLSPESGQLDVSVYVDSLGYATIHLGNSMTLRLNESDLLEFSEIIERTIEKLPVRDPEEIQKARRSAVEVPVNF